MWKKCYCFGYQGVFENIVILCPTVEWNKAYKTRSWIGDVRSPKDKSIIIVGWLVVLGLTAL